MGKLSGLASWAQCDQKVLKRWKKGVGESENDMQQCKQRSERCDHKTGMFTVSRCWKRLGRLSLPTPWSSDPLQLLWPRARVTSWVTKGPVPAGPPHHLGQRRWKWIQLPVSCSWLAAWSWFPRLYIHLCFPAACLSDFKLQHCTKARAPREITAAAPRIAHGQVSITEPLRFMYLYLLLYLSVCMCIFISTNRHWIDR